MKHLRKFNEEHLPADRYGNPAQIVGRERVEVRVDVPRAFIDIAKEAGMSMSELKLYLEDYLTDVIFDDSEDNIESFRDAIEQSDFRGEHGDEGMTTYPTR